MRIGHRKLLMAGLVGAFVCQTTLVYSDRTAEKVRPINAKARQGLALWHAHNCGACHQIYGYGGFLGPDLTNAAPRLTRQRLETVLTKGSLQMPAFHLQPDEIDAIEAWLWVLDQTGVGQAREVAPVDPRRVAEAIRELRAANGDSMTSAAARGQQLFQVRCTSCHTPLRATPLGPNLAPDLSTAWKRLGAALIRKTVQEGRPMRGMPPAALTVAQEEDLLAFLRWLNEYRIALAAKVQHGRDPGSVPWWEFR